MNILKITALTGVVFLTAFLGYKYLTADPPGYCSAQQRYITDAELIKQALQLREGEIARHGGMDAYEKDFIRLNRHPEEAVRDFDIKDPNCCRVYRDKSQCDFGYPLCVVLNYRPDKRIPEHMRVGRIYLFDECGKLQENF